MTKRYLVTVGVFGFLAVIFGTIGNHVLKDKLITANLESFQTGVQYMMYHTLALLALSFGHKMFSKSFLNVVYVLFFVGIVLFSFGLIIQSTTEYTALGLGPMSFLIPMGGLSFLAGWVYIIYMGLNFKHTKSHSKHHHSRSSSSSSSNSSEE
ncbi:MAG: DUF423 domain-containing protein [Bacteroidetes bacterium]|nr:MAG: DUF423 domain-containing protein [Bacteroidota bacterium]